VLDIGCGFGRVEKFLSGRCSEIWGVDISRTALKGARANTRDLSNVRYRLVDGRTLPFPDAYFDLVFSLSTLQHMPREDAYCYLVEIRRVLRPGGKFYLTFKWLNEETGAVFAAHALSGDRTLTRVRYYTPQEVKELIVLAGLQLDSLSTVKETGHILAVGSRSPG